MTPMHGEVFSLFIRKYHILPTNVQYIWWHYNPATDTPEADCDTSMPMTHEVVK